ncbi:MAG: signal recognition particle-docking protein FtsY [Pseudomonadota bacterium]
MTENSLAKLRRKLNRGDSWLTTDLARLFTADKLGENALEEIETRLLSADAGVEATAIIVSHLRREVMSGRLNTPMQLRAALKASVLDLLAPCEKPLEITGHTRPFVCMVVGVNGVGKTTTIGKLALRYKRENKKVLLAAGDTFRAAATQQLRTWAERAQVPLIAQDEGADSASVIFDAVQSAKARGMDLVIADTAGRLHTQAHLMDELRKIKRVIQKHDAGAPHEILLVVDATTGQNALNQALQFHEAVGLTGLAVTKLDGTAKGGILLALARKLGLPVRFIGVGEAVEDLETFRAADYAAALIGE